MHAKSTVFCPVCDSPLGYLTENEACSFVCNECKWIFTWDKWKKLGKPLQVDGKKAIACGCASCQARNDQTNRNGLKNRYI